MMKKIKGTFLFLIPILIAALIFISLNQQNVFVTDDSDSDVRSDTAIVKIEAPNKHLNHDGLNLTHYILKEKDSVPLLVVNGNTPTFILLINHKNKLCGIKNHSPPINIII